MCDRHFEGINPNMKIEQTTTSDNVSAVASNDVLVAKQLEARKFIDANVWDGEDRSGATNDRATFDPDELQELIDDLIEHLSN